MEVLSPVTQRCDFKGYDIQPEEQVFPECALFHHGFQIGRRCGNHPRVHLSCFGSPQGLDFLFLEYAEQFDLEERRHVSDIIQKQGVALTNRQIDIARRVGVTKPESVRILEVQNIPFPENENLNKAAKETGFLSEDMMGLTLDHSIYICRGHITNRLLSHELRHVYQYEAFGSIPEFLVEYLKQIVLVGYENAPLEQDAKNHEINDE